ncbi:MAG: DUF4244 domain-containing protein [Mycobacteriales bacterium]
MTTEHKGSDSGLDWSDDEGMTTAEYAVGTVAACAFGAVLYKIVTSSQVAGWLSSLIGRALNGAF